MIKMFLATGIALSILILSSCNKSSNIQSGSAVSGTTNDSIISDGHNSSNSLDVEGKYIGTLPCADCEGIETRIILKRDKTYVKQTIYLGKDGKVFEEKGFYTWSIEGNTIALSGIKNAPNQYFIGENKLIQLDMDGNRITGNLAGKYVLLKSL